MDTERKKYLFVIKESYIDKYGQFIGAIHYEKDLTDDELCEEVKDIQSKRPIKFGYMEISGEIKYQGISYIGLADILYGKVWRVCKDYKAYYFDTKKECIEFVRSHFDGEFKKACLMLLAHQKGRAKSIM